MPKACLPTNDLTNEYFSWRLGRQGPSPRPNHQLKYYLEESFWLERAEPALQPKEFFQINVDIK